MISGDPQTQQLLNPSRRETVPVVQTIGCSSEMPLLPQTVPQPWGLSSTKPPGGPEKGSSPRISTDVMKLHQLF